MEHEFLLTRRMRIWILSSNYHTRMSSDPGLWRNRRYSPRVAGGPKSLILMWKFTFRILLYSPHDESSASRLPRTARYLFWVSLTPDAVYIFLLGFEDLLGQCHKLKCQPGWINILLFEHHAQTDPEMIH